MFNVCVRTFVNVMIEVGDGDFRTHPTMSAFVTLGD